MYSKAEVTQLRQAFWTALGQYMAPVPSAEGDTTNWINYKTGVKHVYFRMQADNQLAVADRNWKVTETLSNRG